MGSVERLGALLNQLYSAASDGTSWEPFLSAIANETHSLSAAFMSYDGKNQQASVSYDWGIPDEARRLYVDHYGQIDEWYLRARPRVHTGWMAPSDSLITVRDLTRTEFYNDFVRHYGGAHQCGVVVECEQTRISSLSLCRTIRKGPYGAKEVDILRVLLPHVQRAIQLHRRIANINEATALQSWALDQVPFGIVLLRSNGTVLCANNGAVSMAPALGLTIRKDAIHAKHPRIDARLQQLMRAAVSLSPLGAGGGSMCVTTQSGEKAVLTVTPIKVSVGDLGKAGIALFFNDPAAELPQIHDLLKTIYGITMAEARVVKLVASGEGIPKIAEQLQVSRGTIRSQMKSVFAKTGVSSQSQLAVLLSKLPPGSSANKPRPLKG